MPLFVYQTISLSVLAPSTSFFSRSAGARFSSSFQISSGDLAVPKLGPAVTTMSRSKEMTVEGRGRSVRPKMGCIKNFLGRNGESIFSLVLTGEECIAADEAVSRLPLVLLSKKLWFLAGYGISIE